MNHLDELLAELDAIQCRSASATFARLRVPSSCAHLSTVLADVDPAFINLCDFYESPLLLDARDVVREAITLFRRNPMLSDNSRASINAIPANEIDPAYRALRRHDHFPESWWRKTLRESLVSTLILSPSAESIPVLAHMLRLGLPVSHELAIEQRSPAIRLKLLTCYLKSVATDNNLRAEINALDDAYALLTSLPKVRSETIASANLALIKEASKPQEAPKASARERLHRLARDIGVAAVAQRRTYHTPHEQLLLSKEALSEILRRSARWMPNVQQALYACLLLGRLGEALLKTNNQSQNRCIKARFHETWIERTLPPDSALSRELGGKGYDTVSRSLRLPLPRLLGNELVQIGLRGEGPAALRELQFHLRQVKRETGLPMTLRRLTHLFEYQLEGRLPDEALLVLIGALPCATRNASIHYFSPQASLVAERFRTAIEQLARETKLSVLADGWSVPPPLQSQHIGYSYRVCSDSLRDLVAHVNSQSVLPRGRSTKEQVRLAYNARVAKLTLMYLSATGVRPTGTVVPLLSDTALIERAVLVSEKDSLGYRSTRLVPLTDRLIAEINEFEAWRSAKQIGPRIPVPASPLAMILDAHSTFVIPSIEALSANLPGFRARWPWPNDALRHFFRSNLWDMGAPTDWLRRVMGHYPRHAAMDVPYQSTPIWDGLHEWDHLIDKQLHVIGF